MKSNNNTFFTFHPVINCDVPDYYRETDDNTVHDVDSSFNFIKYIQVTVNEVENDDVVVHQSLAQFEMVTLDPARVGNDLDRTFALACDLDAGIEDILVAMHYPAHYELCDRCDADIQDPISIVSNIYVSPEYRGLGLGISMMEVASRFLSEQFGIESSLFVLGEAAPYEKDPMTGRMIPQQDIERLEKIFEEHWGAIRFGIGSYFALPVYHQSMSRSNTLLA